MRFYFLVVNLVTITRKYYFIWYRGQCLDELSKLSSSSTNLAIGLPLADKSEIKETGIEEVLSTAELPPIVTSSRSVWKSAYQKSVYIDASDFFKLYADPK